MSSTANEISFDPNDIHYMMMKPPLECNDIDECQKIADGKSDDHPCEPEGTCVNREGDWYCTDGTKNWKHDPYGTITKEWTD
jgi:hypothetical protein